MKQDSKIDNAFRGVAKQRDKLLCDVPKLTPARQASLSNFLAREFPIEAALRARATKRDRSLNPPPEIPPQVELALRQLAATAPDRPAGLLDWWKLFRSPQSIVFSACVLIAAAILCFGKWTNPSRPMAEELRRTLRTDEVNVEEMTVANRPPFERAEFFSRKISVRPFSLKTSEPASLQVFLANNNPNFIGGPGLPIDVRLDRPMRVSLMEDETETP